MATRKKSEFPSQQMDQFVVRLPEGMRDMIAAAAKKNGRSMNAEIVHTLEQAYPVEISIAPDGTIGPIPPGAPRELLARVQRASDLLKEIHRELEGGAISGDPVARMKELKELGARINPPKRAKRKPQNSG